MAATDARQSQQAIATRVGHTATAAEAHLLLFSILCLCPCADGLLMPTKAILDPLSLSGCAPRVWLGL